MEHQDIEAVSRDLTRLLATVEGMPPEKLRLISEFSKFLKTLEQTPAGKPVTSKASQTVTVARPNKEARDDYWYRLLPIVAGMPLEKQKLVARFASFLVEVESEDLPLPR